MIFHGLNCLCCDCIKGDDRFCLFVAKKMGCLMSDDTIGESWPPVLYQKNTQLE
jgi:hypothetical protein